MIWIRNSLTRYLRFWIIRLVYEQREQTDRLIEALERKLAVATRQPGQLRGSATRPRKSTAPVARSRTT